MHTLEARWLAERLGEIPTEALSPLLNVGSSTVDFRTRAQPHIDRLVFAPLRERGVEVLHTDIKQAEGVDLVGDLLDAGFRERLRRLGVRALLCSNLLEHVVDPAALGRSMAEALPPGGHALVTVPSAYPLHLDPIDTRLRPSPAEIHALFPGTSKEVEAVLDVGSVADSLRGRPREAVRLGARVLLPFYRPAGWWTAVHRILWLFRDRRVSCVVLRKADRREAPPADAP